MKRNELETFLNDFTYFSKFEFLEEAKEKDELTKIAEKRGIELPSHDLAPFKCIYAFVDRVNKNKCNLPKEEVEKALGTLVGKAIDFNHLRKRVVGYWLDAKLDGEEIIAYGIFFKSNFAEDYVYIKDLMKKGVLAVSFEAWGDKNYREDGSYDFKNIHFAGGALLLKVKPAFPGSEVVEMAEFDDKERVLEFAKEMIPPEHFFHEELVYGSYNCECIKCGHVMKTEEHCKDLKCPECGGQMRRADRPGPGQGNNEIESSRYTMYDNQSIMMALNEVDCLTCEMKGSFQILEVDFEQNTTKVKCWNCGAHMNIDLTPSAKLTKKGRIIKKMVASAEAGAIENYRDFIEKFDGTDEALELAIEASMEESKVLKYKERQQIDDDKFAVVKTEKTKTGKTRKIRMFPIHDPVHIRAALSRLGQDKVRSTLEKLGISIDTVKNKILRRAKQLNMKNLLEKYQKSSIDEVLQEITKVSLKRELSAEEMVKAKKYVDEKGEAITEDEVKTFIVEIGKVAEDAKKVEDEKKVITDAKDKEIGELKQKLETATKKIGELQGKIDEIEKAKVQELIKTRRSELGDFAKDLSDEQILNDDKFEIAKLKMENASLKKQKDVKDPDKGSKKPDLVAGAVSKDTEDPIKASAKKVDLYAWGDLKDDEDSDKE